MNGMTGLARINGLHQVQERTGGGKQQGDAFRRGMQEHADGSAAEQEPEQKNPEQKNLERPMRRGLQPNTNNGRKLVSDVHHIDVVA